MTSIRAKIVAISKEVGQLEFKKTDFQGVDIYTSEYINGMIKPIFDTHGVVPIVNVNYGDAKVSVTVQYIHEGEDDLIQTVEHPLNTQLWGGGNITLTAKYCYILMFQIGTSMDVNLKEKPVEKDNSTSFEKVTKKHGEKTTMTPEHLSPEVFVDKLNVKENGVIPIFTGLDKDNDSRLPKEEYRLNALIENDKQEVFEGMASKSIPVDPKVDVTENSVSGLSDLISSVTKEEGLEEIKPEPVKEEPKPSEELHKRLSEGWLVPVSIDKCIDEVMAIKALDTAYAYLGVSIYNHGDLDKTPVHIMTIIDKFDLRRSNKKVRDIIIQYRVWGEEAFWTIVTATLGKTKEEIEATLASPKKIEELVPETKPVVHLPKLKFEINETLNERPMEEIYAISKGLNEMGIGKYIICSALENMKGQPFYNKEASPDTLVNTFITKASVAQIHEMIEIALNAG